MSWWLDEDPLMYHSAILFCLKIKNDHDHDDYKMIMTSWWLDEDPLMYHSVISLFLKVKIWIKIKDDGPLMSHSDIPFPSENSQ